MSWVELNNNALWNRINVSTSQGVYAMYIDMHLYVNGYGYTYTVCVDVCVCVCACACVRAHVCVRVCAGSCVSTSTTWLCALIVRRSDFA